jgi:hypothetical protein
MDLHYRPDASKRYVRDGCRPSEIARQRPALAARIQGEESYQDFDARKTERGGHYSEDSREWPESSTLSEPPRRFIMDETERCERMNQELRGGHRLDVRGDGDGE